MRILRLIPLAFLLTACHPDDPLDVARGRKGSWLIRRSILRSYDQGTLIDSTDITPVASTFRFFKGGNGRHKVDGIETDLQWAFDTADSSLNVLEGVGTQAFNSYEMKVLRCEESTLQWEQVVTTIDAILTVTTTDLDWQVE